MYLKNKFIATIFAITAFCSFANSPAYAAVRDTAADTVGSISV